jgi:hypothetical protein
MTECDIDYVIHDNIIYEIIDILLIDRCKQIGNKYISLLLFNYIIKLSNKLSNNLSLAYYIINIMSYEDGLNYFNLFNKSASNLSDINTLLAYHFRPRGAHTKGAITAF